MKSQVISKISDSAKQSRKMWSSHLANRERRWNPVRLSGRIKFRSKPAETGPDLDTTPIPAEDENVMETNGRFPGCTHQFHNYCQHTSLHGFRYITQKKRNLNERIFWICWCLFGISSAMYMMSKIWQKWQDNPVLTSIATTNLPVAEINFPAVTIWLDFTMWDQRKVLSTVNKAVSEKLIIQGCRFNYNFSEMRKIIGGLVDPESKNNDNDPKLSDGLDAKKTMKFLRLVSPKCEDYLLRCGLNGNKPSCSELFKLVLTDTGYCCTFNAMDAKIVADARNDSELLQQEEEFVYLQKAVWQFHDEFRHDKGDPESEMNVTKLPTDSLTCSRTYGDDLFPSICRYIHKCRLDPASCKLNVTSASTQSTSPPETLGSGSSTSTPGKNGSNLFRAPGAGRSRGLTLMTDTLRCDDVPTDSFKGLRVYVHGADEFPSVSERGFIVGPGKETQIGVTAIDTYSAEALRPFKAENRECYFSNEINLDYHKEYSRSACVIECESNIVLQECNCVPYYSPAAQNHTICNMRMMLDCVQKAIDVTQRKVGENTNNGKNKKFKLFPDMTAKSKPSMSCVDKCLPACNETFYNIVVSSATFPNQNNPNKTKLLRELIAEGFENLGDINYVSGSISMLRVFFRESTIMQYKRDELFTWEDFVSNLGGVMSLCLGFSLLSLIEVIYFFTIRQLNDRRIHAKESKDEELLNSDFIWVPKK